MVKLLHTLIQKLQKKAVASMVVGERLSAAGFFLGEKGLVQSSEPKIQKMLSMTRDLGFKQPAHVELVRRT